MLVYSPGRTRALLVRGMMQWPLVTAVKMPVSRIILLSPPLDVSELLKFMVIWSKFMLLTICFDEHKPSRRAGPSIPAQLRLEEICPAPS